MRESTLSRRFDTALHLLDRQIIDPDGRLVGKVDDLELAELDNGGWTVSAILTGPGALGIRLGGRTGRWIVAVWQRLSILPSPTPGRIPLALVTHIDSAVHIARSVDELQVAGLEKWTRVFIISRIPGAKHEPN